MLYCTDKFKKEYDRLLKNNSYDNLSSVLCKLFSLGIYDQIKGGNILYGPTELTFYKKRIPDSSGYRLYFLGDDVKEKVFISFIHPKTGKFGLDNISSAKKKEYHVDALKLRKGIYEGVFYEIKIINSVSLEFKLIEEIKDDNNILEKLLNNKK